MKKIILMAVAMLSMTTATFAANEAVEATSVAAYNMNFNMNSLGDALGLNIDQEEAMKDIHTNFASEMMNAAQAGKEDRVALTDKAIQKDLKYVKSVLNDYQYHKYLQLLNATLNNRGIEK